MFEIYGRNNCVWCDRAKELLDTKEIPYRYKNIEMDSAALLDFKILFPGKKTVPQIMKGSLYIGGYENLVEWLKHYTAKS
ncbi:MAG: glutaredoxin [Acinetobacter sp.]|uniref:glutaredoxin family protein n=1 Tax=Acinetobacter sp. TaxID=472 RepID=UPI000FBFACC9|nr:glutaredoxin [Acinetobacter sp.]RUP39326.1 MAG: glutaredoxin [Acinetobacter sp.]